MAIIILSDLDGYSPSKGPYTHSTSPLISSTNQMSQNVLTALYADYSPIRTRVWGTTIGRHNLSILIRTKATF